MKSGAFNKKARDFSGVRKEGHAHPQGLKGKEIGLFYRDRARQRIAENGGKKERIHFGPSITIPPQILQRVRQHLNSFAATNYENVSLEFQQYFQNVLSVDFEEFLEQAKMRQAENCASSDNPPNDLNRHLKEELVAKQTSAGYLRRLAERQKLPTMKQANNILAAIESNQVTLIVGSTGCGKSTQVPQILLENFIDSMRGAECKIVCTQPRRISAISLAERVAAERDERLGHSVGYQIRLESTMPRDCASILYCTTGILLQKLQGDPLLHDVKCVILDEIHERSNDSDLLMAFLKKILPHRRDLIVVLMSATISEKDFLDYFDGCQSVNIEGMLFPVEMVYLPEILLETGFKDFKNKPAIAVKAAQKWKRGKKQLLTAPPEYTCLIAPYLRAIHGDYPASVIEALRCSDSEGCENLDFLEHLIFHICAKKPPGAILVFLPGLDKITKLLLRLENSTTTMGQRFRHQIKVYPLHSMLSTVEQQSIFKPPPQGKRKIILSTILAETSVTIDDVVYVINTGRTKYSHYDPSTNINTLEEVWVTKANSKQRRGRAGRVKPGICYNLFTVARESSMDEKPTPEILRSKLEGIILNLKLLHIKDPFAFLATLINSPKELAVESGIKLLKRIDALDSDADITPLGVHLAHLPIDPQMAKMLLMAALFRCIDPITSVVAALSFKNPFYIPIGQEERVDKIKLEFSEGCRSDHLLMALVVNQYRRVCVEGREGQFCYNNFLSQSTLKQLLSMKQQFVDGLRAAKFLDSHNCTSSSVASNLNSTNYTLLRAIIAAGLYPNMACARSIKRFKNNVNVKCIMSTPEDRSINFHPSSVNAKAGSFDSRYFVYLQKQKSAMLYMLDATMVYPMSLIIFANSVEAAVKEDRPCIAVDNVYFFPCDEATANLIIDLRYQLQHVLKRKALNPSPIDQNSDEEQLLAAIQLLLSLDDYNDFDDYNEPENDEASENN